jgi:hypothetical protein
MDEILDTLNPNDTILINDSELYYFLYTFTAGYTLLLGYLVIVCLTSARSLYIVENNSS